MGDMGHMGGLTNPRPWRGRRQAGFSNTGGPSLPRKRAPFQEKGSFEIVSITSRQGAQRRLFVSNVRFFVYSCSCRVVTVWSTLPVGVFCPCVQSTIYFCEVKSMQDIQQCINQWKYIQYPTWMKSRALCVTDPLNMRKQDTLGQPRVKLAQKMHISA